MEIKLTVNGKEVELTKEQIELLGLKEEKKNPFERKGYDEKYFFIENDGFVYHDLDNLGTPDDARFESANYCKDEKLMEQRALHEILNRLLWRFSCENVELENEWDVPDAHWCISYNVIDKVYATYCNFGCKTVGTVYFPNAEITQRAIDEIIKPFMEEHPDFDPMF